MKRVPILWVAAPLLLIALIILIRMWSNSNNPLPMRDFVEYWSAGRAFLDGRNPYDPLVLLEHQRRILNEPDLDQPVMMWNPPWSLVLVAPFGAMPPQVSHLVWLVLQFVAVIISMMMLIAVYRVPKDRWVYVAGAVAMMAPLHLLIWYGQIGGFCLLGLSGFLFFYDRGQMYRAGMFAALLALKPHLLFGVGLVLILDAAFNARSRRVVVAGGLTLIAAALIAWLYNPMVYSYYYQAIQAPSSEYHRSVRDWKQPLVSYWLRIWIDPSQFRLQFIPTFFASIVIAAIYLTRKNAWKWPIMMPWLVVISAISTAYGAWIFDLVILLVPIVHAASVQRNTGSSYVLLAAYVIYIIINIVTSMLPILMLRQWGVSLGLQGLVYYTPILLALYSWVLHSNSKGRHE